MKVRSLLVVFGFVVLALPSMAAEQEALGEYEGMLKALNTELKKEVPQLTSAQKETFLNARTEYVGLCAKLKVRKKGSQTPEEQKLFIEERKRLIEERDKALYAWVDVTRDILKELAPSLGRDTLDSRLVKHSVLFNATPSALAQYAEKGPKQKKMIDELLADEQLMREMLYAGGAKAGHYWRAMEILRDIQAASDKAKSGILRRLAIATSLELAAPELSLYTMIDPVKRYLFFEKSYLDGELDPDFKDMTTWECRHIINDPYNEEDMAWIREAVKNHRPDLFHARTYASFFRVFPNNWVTRDESLGNTRLQQIINHGGKCGARSGVIRCVNRAFGIPVWGATKPGHAGATYWTPQGWRGIYATYFGNSFWVKDRPDRMLGTVFKVISVAREYPEEYMKVCRLQWIGEVYGEGKMDGLAPTRAKLWPLLAFNTMRVVLEDKHKGKECNGYPWLVDPRGAGTPESSKPKEVEIKDEDRKITVSSAGVITVPAVACTSPTKNTAKIYFLKSYDKGMQLLYAGAGLPESIVYKIKVPQAGKYRLTARLESRAVAPAFSITVNGSEETVSMPVPYTICRWADTKPVDVSLLEGENTLSFKAVVAKEILDNRKIRRSTNMGGLCIKYFTLKSL